MHSYKPIWFITILIVYMNNESINFIGLSCVEFSLKYCYLLGRWEEMGEKKNDKLEKEWF